MQYKYQAEHFMNFDTLHNCEMDIRKIRKQNFELLLENECGPKRGRNRTMASKINVEPNYISLIKNGHREIGNKTARKMEEAFGKEYGWMDILQSNQPQFLEINEEKVIYNTRSASEQDHPEVPVLKGSEVIEFLSDGVLPNEFPKEKSPLPAPEILRIFAIDESSYTNMPLHPPGTRYIVMPMDIIKNGLLTAVALNGSVAIGRYEKSPFGDAKLATAEEKHTLPEDHIVLGRVIQIIPK